MTEIKTVFASPATSREKMEEIISQYDLAVGPFDQNSENELIDFLANKLPYLRALSLQNNRQVFLYLKPIKDGWLIEQINQHSYRGLSGHCLSGLVLDTKDYRGSLPELWVETSSFKGKKFLRYNKKSDGYCRHFLSQANASSWSGIFMSAIDNHEEDRLTQIIVFLHIAKNTFGFQSPIWTSLPSTAERIARTVSAGSKGFFVSGDELPA